MSKRNTGHDVGGGEKEELEEAGYVDVQVLLEMSGVLSRLVPDIFLNIMSRVPLKSLFQCRLVGKNWYKFINSPTFAKVQYEWAINNNSPWVFFWSTRKDLYLVDDQVFDNLETSATAYDLKLTKDERRHEPPMHFQTAGYVNGLVCLASDPDCYVPSSIYICNPIIGEHISIPKSPMYKCSAIPAFGFDPTTNEYKVVRFVHFEDKDGKYLSSEGEVYTLGSSEWRKIENVPHILDPERCGILLNGNLHWILYESDSRVICVFNVGSEKFDLIQPPPHMLKRDYTRKRLVVVKGYLCLLHKESGNPYEIWAMKDYGVQSSWFKKYSFNSNVRDWFMYGSHELIKLKNGEFLLQFEESKNEFMGYLDLEKDTLRPIRIRRSNEHHGYDYYFRSVVQVGSLFSPKDLDKSRRGEERVFSAEETRQTRVLNAEFQAATTLGC